MSLIVGVVFIASAVLKMQSINSFELYIFSFEIFSLNLSALIARIVIGAELALGVGYILNIYHKELFYTILSSLVGFTIFLVGVVAIGREDSCHCFGDLVDISPLESILKNIALIAALSISRHTPKWQSPKMLALSSYLILSVYAIGLYPMIKYPPRGVISLLRGDDSKGVVGNVDVALFEEFIADNHQAEWGESTKMMIFYGIGCKYCKLSAEQLAHIINRNSLSLDKIEVMIWGDDQMITSFLEQSGLEGVSYTILPPDRLLAITKGHIPTNILYDETAEHHFTTINLETTNERRLVEILR